MVHVFLKRGYGKQNPLTTRGKKDSEESTTERHRNVDQGKRKANSLLKKKFTGNSHETIDVILPLGSTRSLFLHCANAPTKEVSE